MFLHPPADSPATVGLFQSDLDERGYVMNLSRVWAWRPEVQSGFAALRTLRTAGFSERAIFEATAFIGFRLAFSTINAALGARPDWQVAAAAPPEVQQAVAYGRPVAERTPSV